MNNSEQILEQICRACMCKNQNFHSLYDEAADRPLTICEMFATTLPQLPIHSNDEFSKLICASCLNTLIIVHKFQEMCIASDTYMRSLLTSSRLSCLDSLTEQQEEIKHIAIAKGDAKLHYLPLATNDPLQLPGSIKIEKNCDAAEDYHDNENRDSEWSDDDDRPLKDITPLTEELQNCIKFEISEVEVQECDMKPFLNRKMGTAADLSVGAVRKVGLYDDDITVTASESDHTDTASEWSAGDDSDYQEKPKQKLRKAEEQQQSTSSNIDETKIYEIEKPHSQPRRKYHFRCHLCDAGFASNYKLKHHARVHLETSPFACEICNYRYTTTGGLALHINIAHELSPPEGHKCSKCPRRFEKRKSLVAHMSSHRDTLLKCKWCNRKFTKLKTLLQHVRSHPESSGFSVSYISCQNIERQLEYQEKKSEHDDDFEWSADDDISYFPAKAPTNKSNKAHVARASVDEIEKPNSRSRRKFNFHCPNCDAGFSSDYKLKHHARLHLKTRPFACKICNYRFKTSKTLAYHNTLTHEMSTSEGFKCPECPRRFEKRESLVSHMKSHRRQLFKCNLCSKKFKELKDLLNHARTHPANQKYISDQDVATPSECSAVVDIDHQSKFVSGIKKSQQQENTPSTYNEESVKDVATQSTSKIKKREKLPKKSSIDNITDEKEIGKLETEQPLKESSANNETSIYKIEKLETEQQSKASSANNETSVYEIAKLETELPSKESSVYEIEKFETEQQSRASSANNETNVHEIEKLETEQQLKASSANNETSVYEIEKPYSQPRRKYHFRCQHCNAGFASDYKLKLHSHLHLQSRQFACEICNYRYRTPKALALHKHNHETPPPDGFKCPECPRRFEKLISLSSHLRNHRITDPEELFKCRLCSKKFKKFITLMQHERTHSEIQKYSCNLCEEAFELSAELEDHINKNHGSKSLVCKYCKKELRNKSTLVIHERQHTNEKPFLCPQCGKSFRTNKTLSDHLLRHSGVKTFQCPECPSKFACDVDRRKHLLIHQGTKPHACDICGQKFSRRDSINKHKKAIHVGKRPYKCGECDMTFAVVQHFHRHKRVHTGEKPYKCKYCEKAYAESGDLTKHLRLHVGEKTYMCAECPEKFKYYTEFREHQRFHYKQQQQGNVGANAEKNILGEVTTEIKIKSTN